MTLKDKRIEWKTRYDAWKDSGKSVAASCRDQEIKVHQMYYWVQPFERGGSHEETSAEAQWLTVQVDEAALPSSGQGLSCYILAQSQ